MSTRNETAVPVSSEAVKERTGRDWEQWLESLDAAGAADWNHRQIVAHLESEHPDVSSWWRQSITLGYERARGKRAVGETADAGFQLGVQRTVAATRAEAWELVTSRPELWLGEGASVAFDEGERYEVPGRGGLEAARGEIRVVKPGDRLRMTWQPADWPAPATLQFTFTEPGAGKTAIHLHLQKLSDADAREAMRERWREAMDRVAEAAS